MAFLKYALELLSPGGYGMFVIPHSFLFKKSASRIRELLIKNTWIRFLADLSAVKIFENNDIYVLLVIFQKKNASLPNPKATILKCNEYPGFALQDVIDGNLKTNDFYKIFETGQNDFRNDEWLVLPPDERNIYSKFSQFEKLENYLRVRQGFISGDDDVFILSEEQVDENEKRIFIPYIPDRRMSPYTLPQKVDKYFFHPYLEGKKIDEEILNDKFPTTYNYLKRNKNKLEKRNTVKKGNIPWWCPTRPRPPKNILIPKLISPHLVITPKFSVDTEGKYGITRSPLLYLKSDYDSEEKLLYYFLGVLNSSPCFWFLSNYSHKYSSNYLMLEPKTLNAIPVPDPTKIGFSQLTKIIKLTEERVNSKGFKAREIEHELDQIIAELYKLNKKEKEIVGMI